MKIFVRSYLKHNLGDDLFLKILNDRYNTGSNKFYILANKNYKSYKLKNVTIINNFFNKIIKLLSLKKTSLEKIYEKKCDLSVILGGSMFIEGNKLFKLHNNKYLVLGSNFGPYYTEQYYNYYYDFFKKSLGVSFRDNYSYNLFSTLNNVSCSPDIVFSLDLSDVNITIDKKVVISVIDCTNREVNKKIYEQSIVNLIYKLDSLGYDIVLMSFCKAEGDELAIKSILQKVNKNLLTKNISQYFYNGNINEALNIIGNSQIVVGSRFHANILGLLMNKTIIPIAYSDKTVNVLNDLNFNGKVFDIRTESVKDINHLTLKDLSYHLNIEKQIISSNDHFKVLDDILIKKDSE